MKTIFERRTNLRKRGFTLIELLVVIGIIVVLVAILVPSINRGKVLSQRTHCAANLRQLSMGLLAFSNDHQGKLPPFITGEQGWAYELPILPYLNLPNANLTWTQASQLPIFVCPSNQIVGQSVFTPNGFSSSYASNNQPGSPGGGVLGKSLSTMNTPAQTVLLLDWSAYLPTCQHGDNPKPNPPNAIYTGPYYAYIFWNYAPNNLSFVDGHVAYTPMYFNGAMPGGTYNDHGDNVPVEWSFSYDPPSQYGYRWTP